MKTMKMSALLVLSLLGLGRLRAQDGKMQDGKTQMTVPLSEPGKPYKLIMRVVYGSIKIVGYEGKDIVIDVEADSAQPRRRKEDGESGNSNGNGNGGGMRKIPLGNSLDITAQEHDNTVQINSGAFRKMKGVTIKVPQNAASIKVGTVNGGEVIVSNVSGEIELTNVNGSITATNVSGSVVATTVNGSVVVTFKSIDPKAPMAFSALNGKIDVTFPADLKANLKLKADQGEVYTDFEVAVDQTVPKINKTEEKNMYRIRIEDWVYGKIGGGGPEVMMKTTYGNIFIRKAK